VANNWYYSGVSYITSILIGIGFAMTIPLSHAEVMTQQHPIVVRIQNPSMSKLAPNAQQNNQTLPHQVPHDMKQVA
jgi:hypothetical protein